MGETRAAEALQRVSGYYFSLGRRQGATEIHQAAVAREG